MTWAVLVHLDFVEERETLPAEVCDKLDAAILLLLEQYGPQLGDPMSIHWPAPATPI